MKKIIIIFLFLFSLISFSAENRVSYIGSFNTLRLGKGYKDYNHIAKAILPFDVVGLLEVMNTKGIQRLTDELNFLDKDGDWDFVISPYPVGTADYKEYYGFVFKRKTVTFLSSLGFFPDEKNNFIREPFGVNFKINNFDFSFILLHSIYGKKITQRQYEASLLNDVYKYYQEKNGSEMDVIIAGDFNLPANDSSFAPLLKNEDNFIYTIDPLTVKTTIGTKGFANSYDNIFLSKKYTSEFKGQSGAIDITKDNFIRTRKEVSDHLPIFIAVDSENDDD